MTTEELTTAKISLYNQFNKEMKHNVQTFDGHYPDQYTKWLENKVIHQSTPIDWDGKLKQAYQEGMSKQFLIDVQWLIDNKAHTVLIDNFIEGGKKLDEIIDRSVTDSNQLKLRGNEIKQINREEANVTPHFQSKNSEFFTIDFQNIQPVTYSNELTEELNQRLMQGHTYLMSVSEGDISVGDTLEAFGFNRNGI